ncbi:MAG: hypothetical protein PUB24_07115 [Lachnospiraceae bacterium]|nr:hypothetical protein [Lachnospiraceae bacterium]
MRPLGEAFHWVVAYRIDGEKEFHIVKNPCWAWCADPFLVKYQGETYIFAEAFLYKTERKGVLVYCKWEGNQFGEWKVSMDEHWHLSFPNVWTQNGTLYMCPESYQRGDVARYRLMDFPNQWRREEILIDNVKYVDTVFVERDNKTYLFSFAPKFSNAEGTLVAYEKTEKGMKKIAEITDDKTLARPGGNFIYDKGEVIRVGQNSEHTYGEGLVFLRVESWFPEYRENEIKRLYAKDVPVDSSLNFCGIHTYNRLDGIEVIDLKYESDFLEEKEAQARVRSIFVNKYRDNWEK